jgi:hypothetical protein
VINSPLPAVAKAGQVIHFQREPFAWHHLVRQKPIAG